MNCRGKEGQERLCVRKKEYPRKKEREQESKGLAWERKEQILGKKAMKVVNQFEGAA